jgi:peptide-methionine (R)-S-oxide reductase
MDSNEDTLKQKLTKEEYAVLREGATEIPFTGEYVHPGEAGMFFCKVCGNQLFDSHAQFDSGTGWPSFDEVLPRAVILKSDDSHGMHRTEVLCAQCSSHLGHVFNDGPTESGMRYCINSVCLNKKEY